MEEWREGRRLLRAMCQRAILVVSPDRKPKRSAGGASSVFLVRELRCQR